MGEKRSGWLKEWWIVLLVAAVVIGGIVIGTGVLFTGWHYVDDHEMYRIIKLYRDRHVLWTDALLFFLRNDFNIRFRPLYWVFRVALSYLVGDHPVAYKVITCLMGIAVYALMYWSARYLKCPNVLSHLFALLVTVGRQFEMWYRVSNQENLGMLFFAVCLYLLARQYREKRFSKKTDAVILIMAVCSALMKESFLLLLPAVVWLRLGLEAVVTVRSVRDVWKLIKKNILFIAVPAAVFLICAVVIVRHVGVNQIGYAGIDVNYGIKGYVWAIQRMCRESLHAYVLLAYVLSGVTALWILGLLVAKRFHVHGSENVGLAAVLLIFGGYIVSTQMVLYAESGMWDRYLLPAVVGFGAVFVIAASCLIRRRPYEILLGCIIGIFLVSRFKLAIVNDSLDYAQKANAVNRVYDIVLAHTEADGIIIDNLGDNEAGTSFSTFMQLQGRLNIYHYLDLQNASADGRNVGDGTQETVTLQDADVFVAWHEDEEESDSLTRGAGSWQKINVMDRYYVYVRE